jgi:HlyD family secretion protein
MPSDQPTLKDLRIAEEAREGAGGRVGVWILLALLLIGVAGGGWWWVRGPAPLVVRAYTVVEQDATGGGAAPAVLNASGYVVARRRATVSSKVTGKVVEVLVEEGKAVTRGQVLARLDDGTARRYLDLAQAELSASRRGAAETEVRLKEARQTQVRTRSLVKDGISGQADLDKADAEVGALEARLELTREQVLVAERQVAVRQNDLDDTTVRAPFSGVAISKDAQPGEMVSPMSAGGGFTRTGLCTIVDMTSLEIEVDVNESYINRVVPAQRVEATLDAYPDWKIPAHVITMVPTADRQKATVLVRIGFEKLDARLSICRRRHPEEGDLHTHVREQPRDTRTARRSCSSSRTTWRNAGQCGWAPPRASRSTSCRACRRVSAWWSMARPIWPTGAS